MQKLLVLLSSLVLGCTSEQAGPALDGSSVKDGSGWPWRAGVGAPFQTLNVVGFNPAVVSLPTADGPHALIVAAHGAGGVPESECDYWRHLSDGRAFVLCLRGERTNNLVPHSGYYYRTHIALGQELQAALAAFAERFPDAPRADALYAGFSQGAIMGAPMIAAHGDRFPYLALIEGGFDYWSRASAQRFARSGGKRVLFSCGTPSCAKKAAVPARWLRSFAVQVRIEYAPGAGHTAGGEVMTRTYRALPWLTAGARGWD